MTSWVSNKLLSQKAWRNSEISSYSRPDSAKAVLEYCPDQQRTAEPQRSNLQPRRSVSFSQNIFVRYLAKVVNGETDVDIAILPTTSPNGWLFILTIWEAAVRGGGFRTITCYWESAEVTLVWNGLVHLPPGTGGKELQQCHAPKLRRYP